MSTFPRRLGREALANLSVKATWRYGLILGLVLAFALTAILAYDHHRRIGGAEQLAVILANSTQGLITLELRNLERAAAGIAGDAARLQATFPEDAMAVMQESIADVLLRHQELESIVLVDRTGAALTPGGGDPALPRWVTQLGNRDDPGRLRLGPPSRAVDGSFVIPLAMQMRAPAAGWVLLRLRLSELQSLIDSIDAGRNSLISLISRDRVVLARTLEREAYVGRRLEDPTLIQRLESGVERQIDRDVRHADGVDRARAYVAMERFPLVIGAGISRDAALGPWYAFVAFSVIGYVMFWAGLLHLLGIIRGSDDHQARLRAQIVEGAERLSLAQRAGHMISWSIRPGEDRFEWSSDTREIFGVSLREANLDYLAFQQLIHPDDREAFVTQARAARDSGGDLSVDYRLIRPDGSVRSMSARGGHVVLPDGGRRMTGVVMDVTERVATQTRLLEAERRFRLMFDRNPLPFWVFEVATLRFVEVNAAALRNYGYSREEFLAMDLYDIRPPEQVPAMLEDLHAPRDAYRDPKVWTHRRRDGSLLQVRVHSADMELDGRAVRLVLAEDVTESQRAQEQLAYRASHDMLTGLPDGPSFAQQLERMLENGSGIAVLHVQFRRFALISDSLGHGVGEEVLLRATQRLREFVQDRGIAARLQSEEFVVAVPMEEDDAGSLGHQLVHLFGKPVIAAGAPQHLDAVFGLALFPADGGNAELLMRNAGLAAHGIPAEQPTGLMRYTAALAERTSARLAMLLRLHRAIEQHEFRLWFQPIFNLRDDRLAGYEALVRWPQPDGSQIPPSEFIGLCEDSGLIVPLGNWVLREAARTWLAFAAAGHAPVPIAVNISITQFLRSDIVEEVRAVLTDLSLPAGAIELEITEGVVMSDPEQVIHTIERLHELGVCLAIDDFGTGYSNLAYLHRLPAHTLKIDRIFVQAVDSDAQKAAICRSIMSLTSNFNMRVTAEGIETPRQLAWLKYHGCDQAQGYLLGRPAPLEQWLHTPPAVPGEDTPVA